MFDIGKMMSQVKEMKQKAEEIQAELAQKEESATAGGTMVTVRLNGHFEMTDLQLSDALYAAHDPAMTRDLIIAAHNEAVRKMQKTVAKEMQKVTGGLPLPPGLF